MCIVGVRGGFCMAGCHMSPRPTVYSDLASGDLDTEGLVARYGLIVILLLNISVLFISHLILLTM